LVFKFPRPLTVVKIYRLICDGHADRALRILSRFYGVPPPKIEVNPDAVYRAYPQDFLRILAVYDPKAKAIYCKTPEIYRWPKDVLHEFFHHLGHCLGIRHDNETPDDFARLFLDSMGDAEILLSPEKRILEVYRVLAALHIMSLSKREIAVLLGPQYRHYPSMLRGKATRYNRKTRKWEITGRGRHIMHLIAKYYRGTETGRKLESIWKEVVNLTERTVRVEELEKLR